MSNSRMGGLISPPPEEMLQIASKRKRATPQPQQTTPNPKPRKQSKPAPASRRTTPIPAYEPPTDVFTPPRIVILTPTISKSSKRKSTTRKPPGLFVKIEPPQIDLSAPVSPPSPTDDPILLSVPSSSPVRSRLPLSLPPSSPPLFDATDPSVGAWSDTDDDDDPTQVGEGDFTGRFRSFSVRTKLDPPSSATRERQEEWGRPVTPFPFRKIERLNLLVDVEMQDEPELPEHTKELHDAPLDTGPHAEESHTHPNAFDFDTSFEDTNNEAAHAEESNAHPDTFTSFEGTNNDAAHTHPDAFNFDKSFEDTNNEAAHPSTFNFNTSFEVAHTYPNAFDFNASFEDTNNEAAHPNTFNSNTSFEDTNNDAAHPNTFNFNTSFEDTNEAAHTHPDAFNFDKSFEDTNEAVPTDTPPNAFNFDTSFDETEPAAEPHVEQDQSIAMEVYHEESHETHGIEHEPTADKPQVRDDEEEHNQDDDEREVREMSLSLDDDEEEHNDDERQVRQVSYDEDEEPADEPEMSHDDEEEHNEDVRKVSHDDEEEHNEDVRKVSHDDEEETPVTPLPASAPNTSTDDSSSSDDDEELEYGVVKISSADPHAAARAAAILKQHDYDCFTRLALRTQKGRHSLASSGIIKTKTHDRTRRRTLGASIIGDRVFIPGSPATTLPALLREAEAAVATPDKFTSTSTLPHLFTPVPGSCTLGLARSLFENADKERTWTKEEWKLLDACFTDERIALGPGDGQLVSVDHVHPENVARRFVNLLGGEGVVCKWGEDWEMENLLQRVKALVNKQRKGFVALPTTPSTPRPNTSTSMFSRIPSMEVPDFTPLSRRAAPPSRRPTLPPPVVAGAPFSDLQDTLEQEQERPKRKLPMSLLAPRYSHLLEEAVAVSQLPDPATTEPEPEASNEAKEAANTSTETEAESETGSPPIETTTPPSTLKNRVKGFLFSYLPTLSKNKNPAPKPKSTSRPGLPLPPASMLGKSRGPINTPARAPLPKPTHPKELVHLNPAPAPPNASLIPRPQKPQRLVELHRVNPPPEKENAAVRPRRSSGCSVKDLVKGFEEMEKSASEKRAEEQKRGELKRVKSVGEWRKTAGLVNGSKPSWRP